MRARLRGTALSLALAVGAQACAAADPWVRSYDGPTELAQSICDEVTGLSAEPARAQRLAALLDDRRVLYAGEPEVDATVRAVTVRDMAHAILDESGLLPPGWSDRRIKLIAACQEGGETARIHIPVLDDRDFAAARAWLKRRTKNE